MPLTENELQEFEEAKRKQLLRTQVQKRFQLAWEIAENIVVRKEDDGQLIAVALLATEISKFIETL